MNQIIRHISSHKNSQSSLQTNNGHIHLDRTHYIRSAKPSLHISNVSTRYRLKHGSQFRHMLEPRDQVLEHQFNFVFTTMPKTNEEKQAFIGSKLEQTVMKKIKEFLVECVSNIISVAFNNLSSGKMDSYTAKEYASKNILVNVHAIYRQTFKSITQNQNLKDLVDIEQFKSYLIRYIDDILQQVFINLADNYPQSPATGSTPRTRQVIQQVNRIDNQSNDFIYANGIKISDYLEYTLDNKGSVSIDFSSEQNYTEFIMKVVNAAIEVIYSSQGDYQERNMMEIFTQFNHHLFYLSQAKSYSSILKTSDKTKSKSNNSLQRSQLINETISFSFHKILQNDKNRLQKVERSYQRDIKIFQEKNPDTNQCLEDMIWLIDNSQQGIESMKQSHKYAIGRKIPAFVKPFSKQQLKSKHFVVKHSSILRVLTKWSGYLENIFQNREENILQREYPFKNIYNESVTLLNESEKKKLINHLESNYKSVKQNFKAILANSYKFIGDCLVGTQTSLSQRVQRYASSRRVSSKFNVVLTNLMVRYLSMLIHHLLIAGAKIHTTKGVQDLNLVVFRVSDLLRSKFKCNQTTFTNLLKTMYILDSSQEMKNKFRLVRIKNKLDDAANNIIINYLFMGKVQCELQLSIQEPKGIQKNHYVFSHFVYELTRGKFGALAQMAIMICQLDPMIQVCQGKQYFEKQIQHQKIPTKKKKQNKQKQSGGQFNILGSIFNKLAQLDYQNEDLFNLEDQKTIENNVSQVCQCNDCQKLINSQEKLLFVAQNPKICNSCMMKGQHPEEQFLDKQLTSIISENIERMVLQRVRSFKQLQKKKQQPFGKSRNCEKNPFQAKDRYLICLNTEGQLTFNALLYLENELDYLILKIDNRVIEQIDSPQFEYSNLDYIKLRKQIKKSHRQANDIPYLCYLIHDLNNIAQQLLERTKNDRTSLTQHLERVIKSFKSYRMEKYMIKKIKFKAEILRCKNAEEWSVLNNCLSPDNSQSPKIQNIKYKHDKMLDFSNITKIEANKSEIKTIPSWLKNCSSLNELILNQNQLSTIDGLPLSLKTLSLAKNNITSIKQLRRFEHLISLNLSNCNLVGSINFNGHPELQQLNLRKNQLYQIEIDNLLHLTKIDFSQNRLTKLDLNKLKDISELFLNKNQLTTIDIGHLTQLSKLNLMTNQLQSLDLNSNYNLIEVNLRDNKIKTFNILKLPKLKQLMLSQNRLVSVSVLKLPQLQTLAVRQNKIQQLTLSEVMKLLKLIADGNSNIMQLPILPESLQELEIDIQVIRSYDFSHTTGLKKLIVYGKIDKRELINVRDKTKIALKQNLGSSRKKSQQCLDYE